MAHPLTVLIPCKNELSNIALCIASVRGIADELLIADSGSTDGTLEYVLTRGDCRVIEGEYKTAGQFKNWALPQAKHSWVLIVEADERVTPALAEEIRTLLGGEPEADGYRIRRRNHLMGRPIRHGDWGRDRVVRLVRRDACRFVGTGDHQIASLTAGGKTLDLEGTLLHFTLRSWHEYLPKFDRYTRIQANEWHAAGVRASWFQMLMRPPLRFFRDYVLHLGFLDGAAGLQLAWTSAFYTFMKQARLWELQQGLSQTMFEADATSLNNAVDAGVVIEGRCRRDGASFSIHQAPGGSRPVGA